MPSFIDNCSQVLLQLRFNFIRLYQTASSLSLENVSSALSEWLDLTAVEATVELWTQLGACVVSWISCLQHTLVLLVQLLRLMVLGTRWSFPYVKPVVVRLIVEFGALSGQQRMVLIASLGIFVLLGYFSWIGGIARLQRRMFAFQERSMQILAAASPFLGVATLVYIPLKLLLTTELFDQVFSLVFLAIPTFQSFRSSWLWIRFTNAHPSKKNSRTVATSIRAWTDFWILSVLFDFSFALVVRLLNVLTRGQPLTQRWLGFALVKLGDTKRAPSVSRTPFPTTPISFFGRAVLTCDNGLRLVHEAAYLIILIAVSTNTVQVVLALRRRLLTTLDSWIFMLFNLRIFEVSVRPQSRQDQTYIVAFVSYLWSLLEHRGHRFITIGIRLLAHLPQVCLLLLPSFALRLVGPLAAVIFPSLAALRSVQLRRFEATNYWLLYFSVRALYNVWWAKLTASPVLSFLPATHIYMAGIFMIQLVVVSPAIVGGWVADLTTRTVYVLKFASNVFSPTSAYSPTPTPINERASFPGVLSSQTSPARATSRNGPDDSPNTSPVKSDRRRRRKTLTSVAPLESTDTVASLSLHSSAQKGRARSPRELHLE